MATLDIILGENGPGDSAYDLRPDAAIVNQTLDIIEGKSEVASDSINRIITEDSEKISLVPIMNSQDKYVIGPQVGEGGVKNIFLARDTNLERHVAYARIKKNARTKINYYRFIRETRILAMLNHENILPIYDCGVDHQYNPYMITKYLNGINLDKILIKLGKNDPKLISSFPRERLIEIFLKVCDAIQYSHSQGVIHLDLKPGNMHIGIDGHVHLIDWGMSRLIGKTHPRRSKVLKGLGQEPLFEGVINGTLGFLAPEQITRRQVPHTTRTDIYQLGAVLYTMIALRSPIKKGTPKEMLARARNGEVKLPHEVKGVKIDKDLSNIIMKAMARLPKSRYTKVQELIDDLNDYLDSIGAEDSKLVKGPSDSRITKGPGDSRVTKGPCDSRVEDEKEKNDDSVNVSGDPEDSKKEFKFSSKGPSKKKINFKKSKAKQNRDKAKDTADENQKDSIQDEPSKGKQNPEDAAPLSSNIDENQISQLSENDIVADDLAAKDNSEGIHSSGQSKEIEIVPYTKKSKLKWLLYIFFFALLVALIALGVIFFIHINNEKALQYLEFTGHGDKIIRLVDKIIALITI
ncbi:MAG: serine/threonine protein kinase [Planctomycetes bacterium]|nr:serine/threonine protein kinase [Planctomycetota bacterium]